MRINMPKYGTTDREMLAMALIGYESEKAKIEGAISAIQQRLDHRGPGRPKLVIDGAERKRRKRGAMSADCKTTNVLIMKQRWAKAKKAGKSRLT